MNDSVSFMVQIKNAPYRNYIVSVFYS